MKLCRSLDAVIMATLYYQRVSLVSFGANISIGSARLHISFDNYQVISNNGLKCS